MLSKVSQLFLLLCRYGHEQYRTFIHKFHNCETPIFVSNRCNIVTNNTPSNSLFYLDTYLRIWYCKLGKQLLDKLSHLPVCRYARTLFEHANITSSNKIAHLIFLSAGFNVLLFFLILSVALLFSLFLQLEYSCHS